MLPSRSPAVLATASGLCCALLSAGCSSKDPIIYHSITFGFDDLGASERTLPYNLGIEPTDAVAEVQNVNLLSRREGEQGRYQTYVVTQLWSTLPARMANQVAHSYFSRRFATVERYPGSFVADCILRTELVHFEEVRKGEENSAVVELRYSLYVRENPSPEARGDLSYRPLSGSGHEFTARGEESFEASGSLRDGSSLTRALRRATEKALDEIWRTILDREKEFPRAPGKFLGP